MSQNPPAFFVDKYEKLFNIFNSGAEINVEPVYDVPRSTPIYAVVNKSAKIKNRQRDTRTSEVQSGKEDRLEESVEFENKWQCYKTFYAHKLRLFIIS
jgi:hypothetical protein